MPWSMMTLSSSSSSNCFSSRCSSSSTSICLPISPGISIMTFGSTSSVLPIESIIAEAWAGGKEGEAAAWASSSSRVSSVPAGIMDNILMASRSLSGRSMMTLGRSSSLSTAAASSSSCSLVRAEGGPKSTLLGAASFATFASASARASVVDGAGTVCCGGKRSSVVSCFRVCVGALATSSHFLSSDSGGTLMRG